MVPPVPPGRALPASLPIKDWEDTPHSATELAGDERRAERHGPPRAALADAGRPVGEVDAQTAVSISKGSIASICSKRSSSCSWSSAPMNTRPSSKL